MKINRNDECWCNSGLKYKKCHMEFDEKLKSLKERGFEVPSHNIIKTKEQIEKIKETKTNEWYMLDKKEYEVEISKNGDEKVLNLTNKPENPEEKVEYGLGIEEHDHEGRVITLEFEDEYVITVYTPNSQNELARLDYRMKWEDDFKEYLKELSKKKSVIVCGDLNVAHKEIDLKDYLITIK